MTNKRAQLTIFVIFVLLVLFAVLIYFAVFSDRSVSTGTQKFGSSNPVYKSVQECVQGAALDSAVSFGYQQGYYSVPENSLNTSLYRIAYYYLKGDNLMQNNQFFEGEFSKIMNDKVLEECSDFSSFEQQDYQIIPGKIKTQSKISEDNVQLNVDYPLTIKNNGTSASFSEFTYKLPVRIGHIIDVSRN